VSGCIFGSMKNEDMKALESMTRKDLIVKQDSDLARMAKLETELANELPKSGPRAAGVGFSRSRDEYEDLKSEVAFINKFLSIE
jgi:hypothetical protein